VKLMSKGREHALAIEGYRDVVVARPHDPVAASSWEDAAERALSHPVDGTKLEDLKLRGRKVCVMVDDWGRPTPASRIVPAIIRRLEMAGVADDDVTFVTGSGMHDPMSEEDLRRKLGDTTCDRFRCFPHDAGDHSRLQFMGITEMGTPVWVNKWVAAADVRIAVGRVHPHISYGYEGGYKMIVPAVAAFETIVRDHALNFSPYSVYGNVRKNPSRAEADACGRLVGLDYILNVVVGFDGQPARAEAGAAVPDVWARCVRFGEEQVWGTRLGRQFDVTVLAAGDEADKGIEENPTYYVGLALDVTRDDGTIIVLMDETIGRKRTVVEGIDLSELSLGDLLRLHEKRTWNLNERQVQHHIKTIRGEFYERRIMSLHSQKLFIVADRFSRHKLARYNARHFTDLGAAFKEAMAPLREPSVLVIPEGRRTFPLVDYSF
jgi:lactate racemase